ncbi:unnamed protein product [Pedinophyceae sp. YPF-701]|nr:unnamed protein product [Pedinophyceae sp. YPF-701]
MGTANGDVGVAFAMVIGAGAATILGACFVFYGKKANKSLLAGSLGASAGVMLYVSFVEIFATKSFEAFEDYGLTPEEAQRYATFCFFGGMLFIFLLDKVVHFLAERDNHHEHDRMNPHRIENVPSDPAAAAGGRVVATIDDGDEAAPGPCPALPEGSSGVAATTGAGDITREVTPAPAREGASSTTPNPTCVCNADLGLLEPPSSGPVGAKGNDWHNIEVGEIDEYERKRLNKMGVMTALAIGLHNFPEGLATFVAALADTSTGIAIAVAIALHNVPEGLCVAMPVYYSTGSRWKGLMWAAISALSEPLGGLLGYAVLANSFSDLAYAILFSLVGGMMVYISVRELIPTALRNAPDDKFVTYSCFGGMVVMAASLLLFQI